MRRNLIFIFPLFFLFDFLTCQLDTSDEEQIMKKTKVLACIAVTKNRMKQDAQFIQGLVSNINQHFNINDGSNKVLSLCLVNCYSRITTDKAFEVITAMHQSQAGELNSLTEEHKELLGLKDGQSSTGEISKETFARDFQEINIILKDLNKEHDQLKKEGVSSKGKEKDKTQQTSKASRSESNEKEESMLSQMFYSYINFWMSFLKGIFTVMKFDNFFGIGFMIIGAFIVLNLLRNIFTTQKKKKKVVKTVENTNKSEQVNNEEKLD